MTALKNVLDGYTSEVTEFQHLEEDIRRLETTSSVFCSSLEKAVQQMVPKIIEGIINSVLIFLCDSFNNDDHRFSEIDFKNKQLDHLSQSKRNCENKLKAQQEKISQLELELAAARE